MKPITVEELYKAQEYVSQNKDEGKETMIAFEEAFPEFDLRSMAFMCLGIHVGMKIVEWRREEECQTQNTTPTTTI